MGLIVAGKTFEKATNFNSMRESTFSLTSNEPFRLFTQIKIKTEQQKHANEAISTRSRKIECLSLINMMYTGNSSKFYDLTG